MALTADIGANTREAQRNIKDLSRVLDENSDALDDLAREGSQAGDKIERTFREMVQDAGKAEAAVKDVGDKGFKRAGDATGEFKNEAAQNFSEIASSFDGSMGSIGEMAQGTLGGIASAGLPGVSLAAGATAVAVGGITARFEAMGERSAEIKEGIIADYLELGDALDKEAVDARVRDILGVEQTRKEAELLAEILDINVGRAALAMAGDFESAGVTAAQVMDGIANASGNVDYDRWNDLKNTIDSTTAAMEAGKDAAAAQEDAQRRTAATAKTAQAETRTEVEKTRDALLGARDAMQTPIIVPLKVDTSGLTTAQNSLRELQRSAARGVDVIVRSGQVVWQ